MISCLSFSLGSNLSSDFHLGEIDTCEVDGKFLKVMSADGLMVCLKPEKLLLHRNIPDLKFQKPENSLPANWSLTNSGLWNSIAFWPFCLQSAAQDIHNYANMTKTNVANIDSSLVDSIPEYKTAAPVVLDFNMSKTTLGDLVKSGELWWAPRPLKAYKSPSGLDLNLAVLQAMRVSKK